MTDYQCQCGERIYCLKHHPAMSLPDLGPNPFFKQVPEVSNYKSHHWDGTSDFICTKCGLVNLSWRHIRCTSPQTQQDLQAESARIWEKYYKGRGEK